MLKLLFPLLIMMSFLGSWEMIQVSMFLVCFFLMSCISHDFYMMSVGYSLGVDYLSYVLILLSAWIMMTMVI